MSCPRMLLLASNYAARYWTLVPQVLDTGKRGDIPRSRKFGSFQKPFSVHGPHRSPVSQLQILEAESGVEEGRSPLDGSPRP